MKLNVIYIKICDKWWGFLLFLFFLILFIFVYINIFVYIFFGEVFFFYLFLVLMISMMMFFSWVVLSGIVLGIFVCKYVELGFYEMLLLMVNFIIIIIFCWGGYRVFIFWCNNVLYGDICLIF